MSNGIPLTPERKAAFLAELARHGIAVRAARAASPQSAQGALSTFTNERPRDPEFAAAWEEALETARADADHEIYRRAVEGYDEPGYEIGRTSWRERSGPSVSTRGVGGNIQK